MGVKSTRHIDFRWVCYKRDVKSFTLKVRIYNILVIISFMTMEFTEKNFICQLKNVVGGCMAL